ncbi:MAG: nucleotidyltransferase family protein [Planctomycetes bacterium]|nr:nucleotidyltransferase family protein [Planctomycetota bacterium]
MIPENKLLFLCTRQKFTPEHKNILIALYREKKIKWDVVWTTARLHGVAPLVYRNLLTCFREGLKIPQEVNERFKLCYYSSIAAEKPRSERIKEILALADNMSADVMLIKGVAMDILVYEHPWYMLPGDIDLIVISRKNGVTDKEKEAIVSSIRRPGIECQYLNHHDVDMGGLLPINFQNMWDNATRIDFMGYGAYVVSPEDMLLTTCINSCRKRFFRLKSLCDIAEIINKYRNLNWEKFVRDAWAYQCNNIVYTALLITRMTLGADMPQEVLEELSYSVLKSKISYCLALCFSRNVPLTFFYPYFERDTEKKVLRKINISLILPYITYTHYQLRGKVNSVQNTEHKRFLLKW